MLEMSVLWHSLGIPSEARESGDMGSSCDMFPLAVCLQDLSEPASKPVLKTPTPLETCLERPSETPLKSVGSPSSRFLTHSTSRESVRSPSSRFLTHSTSRDFCFCIPAWSESCHAFSSTGGLALSKMWKAKTKKMM